MASERDSSPKAAVTAGGIAGDLPFVSPVFHVAPAIKDELNTLRAPLVPTACWRMDGTRFAFDSSFIGPDARTELGLLAARRPPDAPDAGLLSVFGHADATGADAYNKALSGRRAIAVYALLVRDAGLWEKLYAKKEGGDAWGVRAVQTMLEALGHDPGAIDGSSGPRTRGAIERFQAAAGLATSGEADAGTRAALFLAYMDALCTDGAGKPFTYTPKDFLGGGSDADGKAAYQGCGELNPVLVPSKRRLEILNRPENRGERDKANRVNRRVVIYLFPANTRFRTEKWPCPRATEGDAGCRKMLWKNADERRNATVRGREHALLQATFACRFYDGLARFSPCEGARRTVEIWLLDGDHKRMPGAPFRATVGSVTVTGIADASGRAHLAEIFPPGECLLEWGAAPGDAAAGDADASASPGDVATPGTYRHKLHLALDFDEDAEEEDTDREAEVRLRNLGYSPHRSLAENVAEFQKDYGLAPASWPDGDTKAALWQAHASGTEATVAPPAANADDVDARFRPLDAEDTYAPAATLHPDDAEEWAARRTEWQARQSPPGADDAAPESER